MRFPYLVAMWMDGSYHDLSHELVGTWVDALLGTENDVYVRTLKHEAIFT